MQILEELLLLLPQTAHQVVTMAVGAVVLVIMLATVALAHQVTVWAMETV